MSKFVISKKIVNVALSDTILANGDPQLDKSVLIQSFKNQTNGNDYPTVKGILNGHVVFEGQLKHQLSKSEWARYRITALVPFNDPILNTDDQSLLFYLPPSKAIPFITFTFERRIGPNGY